MKRVSIILLIGFIILGGAGLVTFIEKNKKIKENSQPNFSEIAEELSLKGDFIEAKKMYKKIMENTDDPNTLKEIQKKIEELNIRIISSSIIDECSTKYVVKPNDMLAKIADKFNTTVEIIKRVNNLKSDMIWPGQEFKINICKFSIVVDKSQNLLFLKVGDEVIKTYIVSTGKDNSTPTGNFKIVNKLINPTWFKTGAVIPPGSPENILGSRWMGFDIKGYGIHGTTEPNNLGKQITMGCVRMRNQDVDELFDIVPVNTEVIIID